jgi:hypothetical protein
MPAPKRPNTAAATAAVRRRGDETAADRLRAHGWLVISPEVSVTDTPEIKVKLFTVWVPVLWPDFEDFGHLLPVAQREALTAHQGHGVVALNSAFGWRALHCSQCDQQIWTIEAQGEGTDE